MNYISQIPTYAEDRNAILDDLLDLLWTEDIAGLRSNVLSSQQDNHATITIGGKEIVVRLQPDHWRGGGRPLGIEHAQTCKTLEPSELLWLVLNDLPELSLPVLDRTMRQLGQSEKNAGLVKAMGTVLSNAGRQPGALENDLLWERMAAWRDRPFHPLAHSRGSWGAGEIEEYGAEFGRYFPLRWCAVEKSQLLASPRAKGADQPPPFWMTPSRPCLVRSWRFWGSIRRMKRCRSIRGKPTTSFLESFLRNSRMGGSPCWSSEAHWLPRHRRFGVSRFPVSQGAISSCRSMWKPWAFAGC